MTTPLLLLTLALAAADAETLRGIVTDPDGRPVAGVDVYDVSTGWMEDELLTPQRTGEDGAFTFSGWQSGAAGLRASVLCYKPGWAISGLFVYDAFHAPDDTTIVLQPSRSVSLAVVSPDGAPMQDASVALVFFGHRGVYGNEHVLSRIVPTLTTGPDGRATLEALPADAEFRVQIDAPDYGRQEVFLKADADERTIQLRRAGRLRGRITADDPQAVAGVTVSASSVAEDSGVGITRGRAEVHTDAEGRFEVPVLAEGKVEIRVTPVPGSRYRRQGEPVTTTLEAEQTTEVSVSLVRGTLVRGTVLEAGSREPIAGIEVGAWTRTGDSARAETDEAGRFEFAFGPGQMWVNLRQVASPWLQPVGINRGATIEPGVEEITLDPVLLKRGAALAGTVVDHDNRPVPGARVRANWRAAALEETSFTLGGASTVSDERGEFTIEPVDPEAQLGLFAHTRTHASPEVVTAHAGASEPVTLRILPEAAAVIAGRVLDEAGRPVARARVQFHAVNRDPAGIAFGQSIVRLGGERELTTDAEGRFRTPHPLPRATTYALSVSAPGMVAHNTGHLDLGRDADPAIVADVTLERLRTLAGRVVDSGGQPVAGADVFCHGQERGSQASATTGDDGRFALEGIHPDAPFVFARKDGFRFAGAPVPRTAEADDAPRIVLTRRDEPAPPRPAAHTLSEPERCAQLVELLAPVWDRLSDVASDYFRVELLRRMAICDPQFALDRLETIASPASQADLLLAVGHSNDALELAEAIPDPYRRTHAWLNAADAVPAGQMHDMLAQALLHARTVQDPARRVVLLANVAQKLIDSGAQAAAESILAEGRPLAAELATAEWSGFARGHFAERLCLVDPAGALELVKDLEDDSAWDRHHANIAHQLAAIDSDRAEGLLRRLRSDYRRDSISVRVCYRMATVDLDRARRIVSDIGQPQFRVQALGVMAQALAERDPETARDLLRAAFDDLPSGPGDPWSPRQLFSAAMSLVRVSHTADPENADEYFWRAVAAHAGPAAFDYPGERREVEQDQETARLALFLSLEGRHPEVARQLMEPVFARLEERDSFRDLYRANAIFAAAALGDPERASRLLAAYFDLSSADDLRSIPQPWMTMADALVKTDEELWDFVRKEVLHLWVIDTLDH